MSKTKILICGASGFIGQNMYEYFSKLPEFQVEGTYFHNESVNREEFRNRLWRVDFRDRHEAQKFTEGFDIIINAAAMTDGIGVFSRKEIEAKYVADNNLINSNLAEAAFINKIKHFIFLSCTIMYPSSSRPLMETEHDLSNAPFAYRMPGKMKLFGEDLCELYSDFGTTKYTAIRHTNIYGPHDKFDLTRGHVLAATVEKVMKASPGDTITVWGKGEASRDFLYVDDLIEFIMKAIYTQKNSFEVFNVGLGKTYTVNELVKTIISHAGKELKVVHDPTKPSIEMNMNIAIEKALRVIGWQAKTSLDEGISKTIKWYKQNHPQ